jgi:hypothetical protein
MKTKGGAMHRGDTLPFVNGYELEKKGVPSVHGTVNGTVKEFS